MAGGIARKGWGRAALFATLALGLLLPGWQVAPVRAVGLTRYVAPTGSSDPANDCTVIPCKTIQQAIGKAGEGDVIQIAPHTYPEHLAVNKSIVLRGGGAGNTVVDGSGSGRVLEVTNAAGQNTSVTVEQLTLRKGFAPQGGGILAQVYSLTLREVVLENNVAAGGGGGIACLAGNVSVYESTLRTNDSPNGAAVQVSGGCSTFYLRDSAVVLNDPDWARPAISVAGAASLANVTVGFNAGPGLEVTAGGSASLDHVSLGNNFAGGTPGGELRVAPGGKAYLVNTLLVGTTPANCLGGAGDLVSLGYNLSDDGSCALNQPGDLPNTDPKLLALADYGGSTLTFGIPGDSPAVDAGTDGGMPLSFDQRGLPRRDGDLDGVVRSDIGAFEYQTHGVWLPLICR